MGTWTPKARKASTKQTFRCRTGSAAQRFHGSSLRVLPQETSAFRTLSRHCTPSTHTHSYAKMPRYKVRSRPRSFHDAQPWRLAAANHAVLLSVFWPSLCWYYFVLAVSSLYSCGCLISLQHSAPTRLRRLSPQASCSRIAASKYLVYALRRYRSVEV